jgi:hypothetical protein
MELERISQVLRKLFIFIAEADNTIETSAVEYKVKFKNTGFAL